MQIRIAPSIGGGYAGTPQEVWGVSEYTDDTKPCVFFGLYGLNDFYTLWRHKGQRFVLFAGSDIRHLKNGYWFDDKGEIRIDPKPIAEWINKNCDCWVENHREQEVLKEIGIDVRVCPSFLGNVDDYKIEFKPSDKVRLYTSVSGDDFKLYGWDKIDELAEKNPNVEFHLYGNKTKWETDKKNVIIHGRVSQDEMNKEIKEMSGALRLTEMDGFSEILAKSVLWGQYPVSLIPYPGMFEPKDIDLIKNLKEPNINARNYYLSITNKFPWNTK